MKGFKKGVNMKCSANSHFAEGGAVKKRPASDYTPGANKEANKRDGWAPNLPKAAREDIEKRFGKNPPVKRAMGGIIGKVKAKVAAEPQKPKGGGMLGQIAAKIAPQKTAKPPSPLGSSPKIPPAATSAPIPRPAPAAGGRGVPSHNRTPLFGKR